MTGGAPLADGRRPHLVVLLEFQSETDVDMARRMNEYLCLLELNQRDVDLLGKEALALDVLAVVIHNGATARSASAARFGPLLGPPTEAGREINQWQAYVVIDYPRCACHTPAEFLIAQPTSVIAEPRFRSIFSDERG